MGDKTGIQWTDATWNPVVGCSVISPGCKRCYAMKLASRIERMTPGTHYAGTTQMTKAGAVWTGKLAQAPDHLLFQPMRWKRPRTIFVNSMSDLFHEAVPDAWIDRVFAVMALCPQHRFQVLTKRSARMRGYMTAHTQEGWMTGHACGRVASEVEDLRKSDLCRAMGLGPNGVGPTPHGEPGATWWPLPNVWLGVSTEDQQRADERIADLLATPAAVRFISAEPLLESIDLTRLRRERREGYGPGHTDALRGWTRGDGHGYREFDAPAKLDWVIVGGESGKDARPMNPQWARDLRDQCEAASVPFFFKQWGEWVSVSEEEGVGPHHTFPDHRSVRRIGKKAAGRRLDGVEHNGMPA